MKTIKKEPSGNSSAEKFNVCMCIYIHIYVYKIKKFIEYANRNLGIT